MRRYELSLIFALCCFIRGTQTELKQQVERIKDHIVTLEEATIEAKTLGDANTRGSKDGTGCGRCSLQERLYCESPALLNDHCCCDTRLREPLSYAPHECWIQLPPAEPCVPVAENCAEYSRVMDCCCKNVLLRKYYTGGPNNWVPYILGEMFISWMGQQQRPTAGQTEGDPVQQDALDSEGHNRLVSGAKKHSRSRSWLLTVASLILPLIVWLLPE